MVKEIRGRSGAGSASAHGLVPQNLSPDKHVDVCVDSEEDRGSTPLASIFIGNSPTKTGLLTTGLTTSLHKSLSFVIVRQSRDLTLLHLLIRSAPI